MTPPTLSVIVPSFGRPAYLERCVAAIAAQRHPVNEVVVVGRKDDAETAAAAVRAGAAYDVATSYATVRDAGHLPPLARGVAVATGEVCCFLDDDSEPWRAWSESLVPHYDDPSVGGVGGLVVQPGDITWRASATVCRIPWSGRLDRLHGERVPTEWRARDVDVLPGGNMSYRTALLREYPWDARINRGAATEYEVHLAAWVRRRGFRLVYDPNAIVTHLMAPRPEIGRDRTRKSVADYSHNVVYIAGQALPPHQATLAIAHSFLVGTRASYGIATAIGDVFLGNGRAVRDSLGPSFAGKLAGLRSLVEHRRAGPAPLAAVDSEAAADEREVEECDHREVEREGERQPQRDDERDTEGDGGDRASLAG